MSQEKKQDTDNSRIKKYAALFASLFTIYAGIVSTTGEDLGNIIKISVFMILGTIAVFMLEYFFKSGNRKMKNYLSTSFVSIIVFFLLWNMLAIMFPVGIFKPYYDNFLAGEKDDKEGSVGDPVNADFMKIIGTVSCAGERQTGVSVRLDSENLYKTDEKGNFELTLKKNSDDNRNLVFKLANQEFSKNIAQENEVILDFEYCPENKTKTKTIRVSGKVAVRYVDNFEGHIRFSNSKTDKEIEISDKNPGYSETFEIPENEPINVFFSLMDLDSFTLEGNPLILDKNDPGRVLKFQKRTNLYGRRLKQAEAEMSSGNYSSAFKILDLMWKNKLGYSNHSKYNILLQKAIAAEKANNLTESVKTFEYIEEQSFFSRLKLSTKKNYWGERLDVLMKVCKYFSLKSPEYEMAEKIVSNETIRERWIPFVLGIKQTLQISDKYFTDFENKKSVRKQIQKIKEITGRP